MSAVDLALACRHCRTRWPGETVMEAVKLHMEVEHDTNEVQLDLVPVCRCGAEMTPGGNHALADGRVRTDVTCPACKRSGHVDHRPKA